MFVLKRHKINMHVLYNVENFLEKEVIYLPNITCNP